MEMTLSIELRQYQHPCCTFSSKPPKYLIRLACKTTRQVDILTLYVIVCIYTHIKHILTCFFWGCEGGIGGEELDANFGLELHVHLLPHLLLHYILLPCISTRAHLMLGYMFFLGIDTIRYLLRLNIEAHL